MKPRPSLLHTTAEAGDGIDGMGEDDRRDVIVRTEVTGGAQPTPQTKMMPLNNRQWHLLFFLFFFSFFEKKQRRDA